jgi:hypothetical protein
MPSDSGTTYVYLGHGEALYLIENFSHFVRRWQRAFRRRRFFFVRYAGRDMWLNPLRITLVESQWPNREASDGRRQDAPGV